MQVEQSTTTVVRKQASHGGRTALSIVLSVVACWALYAAVGSFAVYLFVRLPLSDFLHSYLPIPGFVVGCVLLYVSARLWRRWRMGVGVVAVIEGAMLGLPTAVSLAGREPMNAASLGIFTVGVVGCVVGIALIGWQKVLDGRAG